VDVEGDMRVLVLCVSAVPRQGNTRFRFDTLVDGKVSPAGEGNLLVEVKVGSLVGIVCVFLMAAGMALWPVKAAVVLMLGLFVMPA
jgi:hypothetical protein